MNSQYSGSVCVPSTFYKASFLKVSEKTDISDIPDKYALISKAILRVRSNVNFISIVRFAVCRFSGPEIFSLFSFLFQLRKS
jgi:hypothetical protein